MSTAIGKSIVTFGLAFVAGAVGAALGWLAAASAADVVLERLGMPNMEGGRAMFALVGIGPFGAIAGLVLGVWLVLRFYVGRAGVARVAGYSAAVALLCAGIGAAYAGFLYLSDDVLVRNGPAPQAKFEIRFPAGASLPHALEGSTSTPTRIPPRLISVPPHLMAAGLGFQAASISISAPRAGCSSSAFPASQTGYFC
jgi:hypothetical protein